MHHGVGFYCHSEVLCSHSEYIRKLYNDFTKLVERSNQRRRFLRVFIDGHHIDVIRQVMDYLYKGMIQCSLAEVPNLLHLCAYFQVR